MTFPHQIAHREHHLVLPTLTRGRSCIAPLPRTMLGIALALALAPCTLAQAPAAPLDATLIKAETLVGKALFLRGFYAANELAYDTDGRVQGAPKVQDWTFCGINVLKTGRRKPNEIELDGVRVAIRYNQESHQFERHPQKDEAVRILVATAAPSAEPAGGPIEAQRFDRSLDAIFSQGIDPALQRSMPEFWRHYFDPALPWSKDELTDVRIVTPGSAEAQQMKSLVNPIVDHRENAKFTDLAVRDRVAGEIDLRMVVDKAGTPRRIVIVRPLGYGLDARAVDAVEKWRFHPGTLDGAPIATAILVREAFDVPAPQHR